MFNFKISVKMRRVILVIMCIFGVVSLNAQKQAAKENSKVSEVTLSCKMHCGDCAEKVKKQLSFTKGVKDVQPNLEKQEVVVKYQNDKTDADKLIASLSEAGYAAKVATSEKKCSGEKATGCPKEKKGCSGEHGASCSGKAKGGEHGTGCPGKAKGNEHGKDSKRKE